MHKYCLRVRTLGFRLANISVLAMKSQPVYPKQLKHPQISSDSALMWSGDSFEDQYKYKKGLHSYFWGSIIRTATAGLEKLAITHNVAQTKICNLHTPPFCIKQQIFRFQVPMYHPVAVTVLYTCYNLIIHSTQIAQVTIWAKRIVLKLENNLKFLFCREREP